jgi:hypothetical protein
MRSLRLRWMISMGTATLLGACAAPRTHVDPAMRPADVRARIVTLLPTTVRDRQGWATDIQAAFAALEIRPTNANLCATLAVTEQESSFKADPVVPGLARIARAEIDKRAASLHIPRFAVSAALLLKSSDGKRYEQRLAAIQTEQQLSRIYEELIASVPLGKTLFADANPVRTGGPMQVSVSFSEQYARDRGYPYPISDSIRREVFTRRGGVYFGTAHLLDYPAHYDKPLYRFADFNAGRYASRNAALQKAASLASGIPLALDGDLIRHKAGRDGSLVGATEMAVRSLGKQLGLSDSRIHRDLEKGDSATFEETRTYAGVFELAEKLERRKLAHAVIPQIRLESPKITRKLTTEWFARRVDERYQRCLRKASAGR